MHDEQRFFKRSSQTLIPTDPVDTEPSFRTTYKGGHSAHTSVLPFHLSYSLQMATVSTTETVATFATTAPSGVSFVQQQPGLLVTKEFDKALK